MDTNDIQYRRGAIDASECISSAWELVKRRLLLYIGAGIVTWLLVGALPYISIFLMGPILGGYAVLVLRDSRDEPVNFGTLFSGFEKFWPLMFMGLIQMVPGIAAGLMQFAYGLTDSSTDPEVVPINSASDALTTGLTVYFVVFVIGYVLFYIVWSYALTFALPLIVDRGVNIGEAIRLSFGATFSNLGGLIVLGLASGLVALLGMLALCVGIFVAMPVIFAAQVFAYRQVFPLAGVDDVFDYRSGSIFGQ